MNVTPELDDGEEPARDRRSGCARGGAAAALLDELLDAAAADRHERDLGGDEERRSSASRKTMNRSSIADARQPVSPRVCARGSRIRAGTPTASLPGGTFFVTTAPAPVLAPSPTSTGATSIVSTPRNAFGPTRVRFFVAAVPVGGDRAGAHVRAVADLGVAEVAHVVLLDRASRGASS